MTERSILSFFLVLLLFQCGMNGQSDHVTMSFLGHAGYGEVPSATIKADRTLSVGFFFFPGDNPLVPDYSEGEESLLSLNLTFLPFLEVMVRTIKPIEFKGLIFNADQSVSVKLNLLQEKKNLPALSVGITDLASSGPNTRKLHAVYVVGTKSAEINNWYVEGSLGFGTTVVESDDKILQGGFGALAVKRQWVSGFIEYSDHFLNTGLGAHFFKNRLTIQSGFRDLRNMYLGLTYSAKL